MLAILCSATFAFFLSYWIAALICKKTINAFRKTPNKSKSLPTNLNNFEVVEEIKQSKEQQWCIKTPTFQTKFMNSKSPSESGVDVQSKVTNASSNISQTQSKIQPILKVPEKVRFEQPSLASSMNQLNVAMMEQDEFSRKYSQQKEQNAQKSANDIILKQIIKEDIKNETKDKVVELAPLNMETINQQPKSLQKQFVEPFTPIAPTSNENFKDRRQQKSQLQIIQALSCNKLGDKQDHNIQVQIPETFGRKDSDIDPIIAKLIQQIDQLFLNDQEKFMNIINKYKIQETRFTSEKEEEYSTKRYQQLGELLRSKQEELDLMEVQISQYKQQNEEKQSQIKNYKQKIEELQSTVNHLKASQQNTDNTDNQIAINQQYIQQVSLWKTKAITANENLQKQYKIKQALIKHNETLTQQLKQKQNIIVHCNELISQYKKLPNKIQSNGNTPQKEKDQEWAKKQQEYKKKLQQAQNKINRMKAELEAYQNKDESVPKSKIRENIIPQFSQTLKNKPIQQVGDLKDYCDNLKNELQFAQTQIKMLQQTQSQNLKRIEELEKQIQDSNTSILNTQVLQLRSKISRMSPFVNDYENLKKRYFQLKLQKEKVRHQRSAIQLKSSGVKDSDGSSSPNIRLTPVGNKSSSNEGSPAQKFSSSDKKVLGHYKFLLDCTFVNLQEKEFVYETLHNLLKGILKTEKLYNSKTNVSKNPHQLIDNIRGILVLVQLQNGRVVGAYTHEAFSSINPHGSNDNIAFILDITNKRSFTNQSGLNSISYNPTSLVWGFSQLMLKYGQPQVMYTNFCRSHNIYWDGQYKISDFIGADKQWARVNQYQLFRVSRI